MSRNGERKPPRPRIEMLSPAEPREAAAVVAAVEQFLADTAPTPAPSRERGSAWQRAALIEGIQAKEGFASPWGEPRGWGKRHSHLPQGE